MVRIMLKVIINILGYGGVTLIVINKNVAFLLRGTKCDIVMKHVNLETALIYIQ